MGLDREEMRARLDARVADRVAPLALGLCAVFLLFTGVTAIFRPPGATVPLLLIDGLGALLMLGVALAARRSGVPPARAQWAVAALLLVALAASLAAIKLLRLPAQTTNVMLVDLAAASLLLSLPLAMGVLALALGGWLAVMATEPVDEPWLNALFALLATTAVAAMIQVVRLREARRIEELLDSNVEKARQLEDAHRKDARQVRELEAANDSLEAFTYVVAHDLKEPIRSLHVHVDEALGSSDAAEREAHLRQAARTLDNLNRLVVGLLEWSRVTTTPLEPAPIHVPALLDLEESRVQFERTLQEKRVKLLVERDVPLVLGTPALVRQVLGNLILNAARHNDNPSPQVRVYAASDAPRGMVD
ncbi:MAG TPA: hypothetical protein VHH36_00350, partial [Candidatus Thermoplasmatota archaeon]|nr:hypothetical protein [Candidatus Thermoplasmatota archaeon]